LERQGIADHRQATQRAKNGHNLKTAISPHPLSTNAEHAHAPVAIEWIARGDSKVGLVAEKEPREGQEVLIGWLLRSFNNPTRTVVRLI